MDKFALLSDKDRREVFSATASKMGVIEALIEKDFWVCFTLKAIFECEALKNDLLFKGGTSLSKVYNLINRFSEDIDLVLDWRILGITDEDAWTGRSPTQQDKFNLNVDSLGKEYIGSVIKPELEKVLAETTGGQMTISINLEEGHALAVHYPPSFTNSYLLDYVKLEIGPRASRVPFEKAEIMSYASQVYPQVFNLPKIPVKVIKSERTFWEKATILHQIACFPEDKPVPPRSSRHYYDFYQMCNASVRSMALSDLELFQNVADFKERFYRSPKARYDLAKPGTIRLIPSQLKQKSLKEDYARMQEMIFGMDIPSFEEIINCINTLEKEINFLKDTNLTGRNADNNL